MTLIYRTFALESRALAEDGTVTLTASSEAPVTRFGDSEILSHDASAVRLERLRSLGALLINHDANQRVGAIVSADLVDGKVRISARLLSNDAGKNARTEITEGSLRGVSVGYRVHNWQVDEATRTYTATDWEPYEVSLTPIPADASVGVGRSTDATAWRACLPAAPASTINTRTATSEPPVTIPAASPAPAPDHANDERIRSAAYKHAGLVESAARELGVAESVTDAIRALPFNEAFAALQLARAAKVTTPVVSPVVVTADAADKVRAAAEDALMARMGHAPATATLGMRRMRLTEIARRCIIAGGDQRGRDLDDEQLSHYATRSGDYRGRAYTTTDFPGIMANVATKIVARGFEAFIGTWRRWCVVMPINDYKSVQAATLVEGTLGDQESENAPLPNLSLAEESYIRAAKMRGAVVVFSRQAMVNDDLGEIGRRLSQIGATANRTVERAAVTALLAQSYTGATTTGADLTATGATPEAALQKGYGDFMAKTNAAGQIIGAAPGLLLVPPSMMSNAFRVTTPVVGMTDAKVFAGLLTPVVIPHLADLTIPNASPDNFYLSRNPAEADTIVISLLSETPQVFEVDTGAVPGMAYRIEFPFGASATGTRTMQKVTKA